MFVTAWLVTATCDNLEDKYRFHKLELLHNWTLTVLSMQNFISLFLVGLEWHNSVVVEQQTCTVLFLEHCRKVLTWSSRAV